MTVNSHHSLYLLVFSIFCTRSGWAQTEPTESAPPSPKNDRIAYPSFPGGELAPVDPPGSELTERGKNVRGIYLPLSKLVHRSPRLLVKWLKKIGADAVIMDVKDDRGRVTFSRKLPSAKGHPHGIVPRMAKLVKTLKEADIYTIGRLVCFKDNLLFRRLPDAVIRDKRTGKPWRDKAGSSWLDPFSLEAHEYIAGIAEAAAEIGFDEIQLDYIRFPVDGEARYARYPNRDGDLKRFEAIALLLARVDRAISKPLSIDVFGLTANRIGDPQGLGQSIEHLAPHIDAISPMLYVANWPQETWENATEKTVYEIVYGAVTRVRARLNDTVAVRPLLQGFSYRAVNFGPRFIAVQVSAAQDAGAAGHLFWNQSGIYQKVAMAWLRNPAPEVPERDTEAPPAAENTDTATPNESVPPPARADGPLPDTDAPIRRMRRR